MVEESTTTVLVVDDVQENVALLSRILVMNGYRVESAESGLQALEIAGKLLPDIILLDLTMPGMDGFETCSKLKESEATRNTPIIFISGVDNVEEKAKAFRLGGVDYIHKPFDYEEVQARVETHLVLQRLRLQLEQANKELSARVEELTKSQEIIAERENRLSAFVNALPNLSFIMDGDGRYLEVVANETNLLVNQPDNIVGKLVEDVLPTREGARILDAIKEALHTRKTQIIEYKIPVLSGGERWFEGRIALMETNRSGESKVILMASDITERVQLYQEVQRLANLDALTGCFNRRHFMEKAEQEVQRAKRYKHPLTFMMMDIDRFKDFNDRYGHQVGDQLLCHLVNVCNKQLRSIDILGRYGGEEFVVLMPETNISGGVHASERLRKAVEEMKILTPSGKLSITVSVGVTGMDQNSSGDVTLDTMIRHADNALYTAKSEGRNCVRRE